MPILEVSHLTKKFGGLVAVSDASFTVEENRITCLIGPNGSGKTTVFNLITGAIPADGGSVRYKGNELIGKRVVQTVSLGVARTFQDLKLFGEFTVLQNVMVALRGRHGETVPAGLTYSDRSAKAWADIEKAQEILTLFGLSDAAETPVASLPYGMQKLVSLARLYAVDAELLLLDEPSIGLSPNLVQSILQTVRKLADERGLAAVIVEQNVKVALDVADYVLALRGGRVIFEGPASEVSVDKLWDLF